MALITCPECQNEISDRATSCPKCGCPINAAVLQTTSPEPQQKQQPQVQIVKAATSRGVYIILALFFGMFGVHNFYAGRYGVGAAQLLITLILGWFVVGLVITFIWAVIDMIAVTTDGSGNRMM